MHIMYDIVHVHVYVHVHMYVYTIHVWIVVALDNIPYIHVYFISNTLTSSCRGWLVLFLCQKEKLSWQCKCQPSSSYYSVMDVHLAMHVNTQHTHTCIYNVHNTNTCTCIGIYIHVYTVYMYLNSSKLSTPVCDVS